MGKNIIEIFTDGSCKGKNTDSKGNGGWSYKIYNENSLIASGCGNQSETTSPRMELVAFWAAFYSTSIGSEDQIVLYSDNDYVVKGLREWLDGWKKNGWKKSGKKTIEHKDLWESISNKLDLGINLHPVHIKSHQKSELEDSVKRQEAVEFFNDKNNLNLNEKDFMKLVEKNDEVDKIAQKMADKLK